MPDIRVRKIRGGQSSTTSAGAGAGVVIIEKAATAIPGPPGEPGPSGMPGLTGFDGGPAYMFNRLVTTDTDPGTGKFSFNHATIASVTYMYVDASDAFGNDLSAWIQTWDDSSQSPRGTILLKKNGTGQIVIFNITGDITEGDPPIGAPSDTLGYWKIPVEYVLGDMYTNMSLCMFQFAPVGSGGVIIDSSGMVEWETYTNATPVPQTIGGISSGETFSGVSMSEMWDALLYPYQYPAFTSFSISGQTTTLECGIYVTAGSKSFNWGTSNGSNIQSNSINIDDISRSINLATGTLNDGSEILTITAVTQLSSNGTNTWRITGTNTLLQTFIRNWTVTWYAPYFYGVGVQGLSVAQVQALTKQVTGGGNKNYTFNPTNQVYYFAYPASYGALSSILDTNGFETIGDWTRRTESFTNNPPNYNGTTMSYYVYEFNNPTTQTNFVNHFIY